MNDNILVPHMEILEYASGGDAGVIAMGTRGQTADTDRRLGSTTARAIRRSDVPVTTA
jgi:nucleotide-binding universal stress UspA family protein